MPTYTYRCVKCARQEDISHGMNDEYSDICVCGGEMRKVFVPNGIVFKGPGFYKTDSRGK